MTRATAALLGLLGLLGPVAGHAQSFVEAGVGAAWRDLEADPPFDQLELEYDTGTLARLEVGTRYHSGLQLRVGYTYTVYDELTGPGSLAVAQDIQQQEVRAGAFYATPTGVPLGWRLGGGYAYVDEDDGADGYYQRGGYVEAAAIVAAGRRVTLDLATAFVKLGGPQDHDAEIGELRAAAAFHARAMDFTLGARYALIDRESPPADERLLELRVGIAVPWAYTEAAPF